MSWKKPRAMVRSNWPSFWRPSMKRLIGKTDSPYAVKRRGDTREKNWGLCIMEFWSRKFLSLAALVRLYLLARNLLLKLTSY